VKEEDCYTLAEAAEILGVSKRRANKTRRALRIFIFLVLLLVGTASIVAGLRWNIALSSLAADLIRFENVFDLVHPDHSPVVDGIITLIGSLGQILLAFGVAAVIVGLAGITYAYLHHKGDPRWLVSGFRQSFVLGTGALVLLAIGIVVWASGGLSLEDKLASQGGGGASDPMQESALESAVNLLISAQGAETEGEPQKEWDDEFKQARDEANELREQLKSRLSPLR
jgi:hypothetical protein